MNVEQFFPWLNQNQGALVAASTIILVFINVVYAWLNRSLLLENRMMRKAQTEPYLTAYLKASEDAVNITHLIVIDAGQGPAFNISAKIENAEQVFAGYQDAWIKRFPLDGYNVIPPGESFIFFLGVGHQLLREDSPMTPFQIKFEFMDLNGKRHSSISEIDVQLLRGHTRISTNYLEDVSKHLEKISSTLQRAGNGHFGRLQVECVTRDEAKEEFERFIEQHNERRE